MLQEGRQRVGDEGDRVWGIAGLSTHGSVSVKCRVLLLLLLPGQAWAVVGVAQAE